MSYAFLLNQKPATFGEALWNFKEHLVANGWDVADSGDGTGGNYGAGADVHDPGGPYTGTLDLQNSWMRLRAPVAMSPRREFVLHHDTAVVGRMSVLYSSDGIGFTGGAPSATVRPTAADEQVIASNTGNLFGTTDGGKVQDVLVGDAAENFSFFFGMRDAGFASGYAMALWLDALDEANAADPDPALVGINFDGDGTDFAGGASNPLDFGYSSAVTTAGSCRGWYDKGGGGAAWVNYPFGFFGGETGFGNDSRAQISAGLNTAGEMEELSIWFFRGVSAVTQLGFKGRSHLFKATSADIGYFRPHGGTAPFSRMNIGHVSMPWDGATAPI